MAEFGGRLSSLLINYDVTLWLLTATALEEASNQKRPPQLKTCTVNPFSKVWVHPLEPQVRQAFAALNLALVGAKVEDNIVDGDKPLVAWAFKPLHRPHQEGLQVLAQFGFDIEMLKGLAQQQKQLETTGPYRFDSLAGPSSQLIGEAFRLLATVTNRPDLEEPLVRLGKELGHFIYLLDALHDYRKDLRKGQFNGLASCKWSPATGGRQLFDHSLEALQQALVCIPFGQTRPLIDGLLTHLDQSVTKGLAALTPPSKGRWGLNWLAPKKSRAAFVQPAALPTGAACDPTQPKILCDGCDGCGSCCDGCGGCGEGCSGCGEGCSGCGEGCSGCGSGCGECGGGAECCGSCGQGCNVCNNCGSCGECCTIPACECCPHIDLCLCPGSSCGGDVCCTCECESCEATVDCCCCFLDDDNGSGPLYNDPVQADGDNQTQKPAPRKRGWRPFRIKNSKRGQKPDQPVTSSEPTTIEPDLGEADPSG